MDIVGGIKLPVYFDNDATELKLSLNQKVHLNELDVRIVTFYTITAICKDVNAYNEIYSIIYTPGDCFHCTLHPAKLEELIAAKIG